MHSNAKKLLVGAIATLYELFERMDTYHETVPSSDFEEAAEEIYEDLQGVVTLLGDPDLKQLLAQKLTAIDTAIAEEYGDDEDDEDEDSEVDDDIDEWHHEEEDDEYDEEEDTSELVTDIKDILGA